MTLSFEPRLAPDIHTVWIWFDFQKKLITEGLANTLDALAPGSGAMAQASRPYQARFIGLTRPEVGDFFDGQRSEIEFLTMSEFLATTESILRIDFSNRVKTKRKDGLSRRYREIDSEKGEKVRLSEDLLEALKQEGVNVSAFRGTLGLRDWLAHGRYWHPKLGCHYTAELVFDISKELIDSIPV